jgi:phosphoenolpyruvate carboxykinase (ATP)
MAATVYADLLGKRLKKHDVTAWLVNTGWTGGPHGVGSRVKIAYTRAMIHAALSGVLARVKTTQDPVFGLHVPVTCPGIPSEVLNPRNTWDDKSGYDAKAKELARKFHDNFRQFVDAVPKEVQEAGPH